MLTISNLRRQLNHVVPFSQENIKISSQKVEANSTFDRV